MLSFPIKQQLNTQLRCVMLSAISGMIATAFLVLSFPQKAAAWSGTDPYSCSGTALNGFDYIKELKEHNPYYVGEPNQANWDLNTINKAVLIYDVPQSGGITETHIRIADKIEFQESNGTRQIKGVSDLTIPNWPFYDRQLTDNSDGFLQNHFWFTTNTSDTNRYQNMNLYQGALESSFTISTFGSGSGAMSCIASGINVTYQNTWTGKRYASQPPDNGSLADECQPIDTFGIPVPNIACNINKAFKSIGEAISETAKDIGRAFSAILSWLFIPDSEFMNGLFADQKEYWDTKLGFLAFPIQFLTQLFDELGDDSNYGGCTETNCTYNFGNMFGSNVQINFAAMHSLSSGLWSFLLLAIRVTTLYFLIMSLYRIGERIMSGKPVS